MKVLFDTNVVLDVLLVRQPWYPEAAQVWDANQQGQITAAFAAFSLPTIFYLVRRQADLQRAHDSLTICLKSLDIVPVLRSTLELAHALPGNDFEDNLQIACALEAKLDAIVTRDPNGFSGAPVTVLTPAELLARLVPNQQSGTP